MRKFKLSLKEKAFIGVVAILIPILITFVLVYFKNKVYLKNRVIDTLTVIAEAYEGQIYQFLEKAKYVPRISPATVLSEPSYRKQFVAINQQSVNLINILSRISSS